MILLIILVIMFLQYSKRKVYRLVVSLSAVGGGLPLIIQQVLENVVEWANPDERPKHAVCHQVSSYTVVFRASADACFGS